MAVDGELKDGARRLSGAVLALVLALALLLVSSGPASAASRGSTGDEVTAAVQQLFDSQPLNATIYGVWKGGKPIATGALGEAAPGVPATKADHFRIGNVTESMTITLLMQLVDRGKISLDDPISKWFPGVCDESNCDADDITVEMLAYSTSGLVHYPGVAAFNAALYANPFRRWTMPELLAYGLDEDVEFTPGTNFAFSDTGFLLIARLLQRVTGKPVAELARKRLFDKLGMDETILRSNSSIPSPVLHGYTNERGPYEDTIGWSASWIRGIANATTTLADMRDWATALGTGSLLSPRSHALQLGPHNVGLNPKQTPFFHYAMGSGLRNGWVWNNPHVPGYKGMLSYLPDRDVAIAVFTTDGPEANSGARYDAAIYNRIAELVVPDQPPDFPVCTSGC